MRNDSVLIVGSIALDLIETPYARKENVIGGSTTYALIAASKRAPVSIVGVIGDDFPKKGMALYEKYAHNLNDLKIVSGTTFQWGGKYHENWDDRDTLYTELGVFESFNPILSSSNQNRSHIFLANIHPDLQQSVIDQNKNPDALIVVDTMNLWINTALDGLKNVLSNSHILLINESEATLLTGQNTIASCARALQDEGPQTVVIKKGSRGAVLFSEKVQITIDAYPIKQVLDPTGAGDTFGGGFISCLANGGTMDEALINASVLASFCVEGFGTDAIIEADKKEIIRRRTYLQDRIR
mgnify:CR=1 FL=1